MEPDLEVVTGIATEALKNKSALELFVEEDRPSVLHSVQKCLEEGEGQVEARLFNAQGGSTLFQIKGVLLKSEDGSVVGITGSGRDITERRRGEELLDRLHQRNELILCSAAEGILGLDLQGNHTFVNPAAARMLGYEVEELLGRPSHSIWHHTKPDGSTYPEEECLIYTTYRNGAVHRVSNEVFWSKDGTGFPVEYVSTPIYDQGRVAGAVLTFADITDRKQSEDMLRESEDRYRDLVEHSQELICTHDLEGRLLSVNPWAARVLGFSQDELLLMNMRELIVPDVRNEFDGYLEKIRKHGVAQGMLLVRTRNGERRIWEYKNTLRTEGVTEPVVRGMAQDITERKQSEEARIRLNMAVDQAAEAIVITDKEGRIEYVNPSFARITGYLREEAVGQNMRILKSGKQDEMFYRNMWGTISRGEVWRGRFINRKKDGTLYDEESVISPVRNASGKIINFVSGKRDITQEIRMQKHVQTAQRMDWWEPSREALHTTSTTH